MPTHNDDKEPKIHLWEEPESHGPDEIDVEAGYEKTDVRVTGIVVFLTALAVFVAVTGVLCYGIGMVLNAELNKEDGPNSKWTKTVEIRQLGNLPNSPEMQHKVAELAQGLPTPRVQLDDGNQDVADLHAREDLLLENYTWVDKGQGKVRIPIELAMELVAKNGLPVAPDVNHAAALTGDGKPGMVTVRLTNGFARTSFEQEEATAEAVAERRK
ncbi:MAG: hypothetical protein ABSF28_01735 [Terracidiphilus sp.]